ncbi:MAG: ATP-binding cassette domain-containing protein, partial [Ktedonobacteraceae bacterium]|nr:ATP-binding cassette domain-containing protein [Ktedonobacteraceae bacterium]
MLLELENVSKSFGAVAAINNLSCTIAEGEVLGIMGPNGAGKTTLLNLIMGAIPLDKGTIRFAGERINGMQVSAICHRGVGRTYQIPKPFKGMSVLENLLVGELYGGRRQSMQTARRQALEVLERVGLAPKKDAQADSLGLLELKRLELARALSLRPRLLLLDEIAGGLVESEVEVLKGILTDLKQAGQSMLIIEHLLSVLFGVSDRIVVLDFGKLLAEGLPNEVIHNPLVIEAYLGKEDATDGVPASEQPHKPLPTLPSNGTEEEQVPLLHMSHVSAGYGEFQALFDVSLDIRAREIVSLIGLNGAGKTTLIRALTKRLPLQAGDVVFKGESIARRQPHEIADLGIAQCIEGRKIFPELTVLENLE